MEYKKSFGILAIDIGTSSIRITLFEKNKGMKDRQTIKHQISERFSIEELWNRVARLIKNIVNSHPSITIEGIGISSFLGWVALDETGKPLVKAWSWIAKGDAIEYNHYLPKLPSHISQIIGRTINDELGVFIWGKHLRGNGNKGTLLSIKDYCNYRLTGKKCMDRTHASYSGVFSIKEGEWEPRLIKEFNLNESVLPPLGNGSDEVGTVLNDVAQDLSISSKTKVALCGPDGTLAMLGGGGTSTGKTMEVMGTTDVLFQICDYNDDTRLFTSGLIQNCYLLPDMYAVGGPTGMTGGALTWLMDNVLGWNFDSSDYQQMMRTLSERMPGKSGLFIIPSLTGARVPDWVPEMRGTFVGLHTSHDNYDLFKATLEAISFTTKRILDLLALQSSSKQSVIAIGGGAKEIEFLKIRATVSGRKFARPVELEASTIGVLALTASLTGWYESPESAVKIHNPLKEEIYPNSELNKMYNELYEIYEGLLKNMGSWYRSFERRDQDEE